jgi:single-strand DNA-binding protein
MKDQITIVGNIGGDPELRRLADGTPIASFRIASHERRYDQKTSSWVDGTPSWYDVSAFRTLGEHVLASVKRGQRVIVTGALTIRRWESGERSGTAAEIEATAVGHELRFGTTVYTASAPRREEPAEAPSEAPEAEPVAAGAWAAPGAETPF